MKKMDILCAVRDVGMAQALRWELDDGESYTVRIAANGEAALASAWRFVPDILVVDAVLPRLDGLAVVDRLRAVLGERAPRVIGGAMTQMAATEFLRRGAVCVLDVPWRLHEVRAALEQELRVLDTQVDWEAAKADYRRARELLRQIGMRESLHGFDYLAWAAALSFLSEARLFAIGERLYRPIAEHARTTPQNVERLIRHAIESTVDAEGPDSIYAFFGNTIDPTRGKPTNAQMIAMPAQRLRVGKADLHES